MLALAGFLILFGTAAAMLSRKLSISASYSLIPLAVGLLFGIEPSLLFKSATEGIASFLPSACTILLSACFFCGLAETGLFDVVIQKVLSGRSLRPVRLLLVTVLCAAFVMCSGSTTACFLVILPSFLPLYESAGIDRRILLTLTSAVSALGLMLPWSSKCLLLSGLSGVSAGTLWRASLPLQGVGLALCLLLALFYGVRLRRNKKSLPLPAAKAVFPPRPFARTSPRFLAINGALFFLCVVLLAVSSSALTVLVLLLCVFLPLNYRDSAEETALLKKTMQNVCPLVLMMFSVGITLGVLDGTGMTDALSHLLTGAIPAAAAPLAPLFVMLLFTPLLAFMPYHSLYALVPLLLTLVPEADVVKTVLPFLILYPTSGSPLTGLTHLACRTVGEEPLRFARFAQLPLCALSVLSLLFGAAAGLFF